MDRADRQNSSFSACTTSPVIDRKQKEPSLMQCLTTWVVRSVDEVSISRYEKDLSDVKRPRAGERRLQEQVQQSLQPAGQTRSDLRQRRSAAPTPVPQLQGQATNQLPPYDFNPSASQPNFHTYPQQQFGPPGYFEGIYPQPGPGYGQGHGHGMMMGYPSWQGIERPFSPVQGYNAGGGSWYAGGFGWPMR